MKQTVTESMFIDAFEKCGRRGRFSYEALQAIYADLIELEDASGEESELNPIAICCSYSEYDSIQEAAQQYNETPEQIRENTIVMDLPAGGCVIVDY